MEKYAFDDTPKAFKRMLQRKNEIMERQGSAGKKNKTDAVEMKGSSSFKRSFDNSNSSTSSTNSSRPYHTTTAASTKNNSSETPSKVIKKTLTNYSSSSSSSASSGFKIIRAKRKAHLQNRALKKKQKRTGNILDQNLHNSLKRTDVRDVVQEPPRLDVKPKKTFKRVLDDKTAVRAWASEDEDLDGEDDGANYSEDD